MSEPMHQSIYRAWDGKRMDYDYRDVGMWHGVLVAEGDTILLEAIGLKDKHGKHIFEGDIVSYLGRILEVKRQPAAFRFFDHARQQWHLTRIADVERMAVVGNIYESPGLVPFNREKTVPWPEFQELEAREG